jgi:hypothetical protein
VGSPLLQMRRQANLEGMITIVFQDFVGADKLQHQFPSKSLRKVDVLGGDVNKVIFDEWTGSVSLIRISRLFDMCSNNAIVGLASMLIFVAGQSS